MSARCLHAALVLGLTLGTAACATSSETAGPAPKPQTQQADGSSIERAVVIHEDDTRRGIAAENRWIQTNLPGCRKTGQALLQHNGGIYDQIRLRCANGQTRAVYFDIRHFFGKIDGRPLM
ncbi:hypothetical protein [Neisseria shayeganii]|uniref:Lipoprotein n=1 Tax=Neisseria shayeganii TaxID=607712 RepID=A0A7D7SQ02_9NEIS|nr:hypothetical protein [Neisseria shayeganii]QMT40690.1 hypothetical protein H3L94_01075 [Neisseria shayeganii]